MDIREILEAVDQLNEALLRRGSRGEEVRQLQQQLGMTGNEVDGIFGPNTERAVRTFQQNSGIQVDGIVGPQTRAAIAQYAGDSADPAGDAQATARDAQDAANRQGREQSMQDLIRAQGRNPNSPGNMDARDARNQAAADAGAAAALDNRDMFGRTTRSTDRRPTINNPNRQAGSTAPSQLRLRRQVLPAIDQLLSRVTPGGR